MAEIARDQTGVKPRDESIDAEHRQAQPLEESAGVGLDIGAFQPERPDAAVTGDERPAGSEEVTLGHSEGEPFERNVAAASFAYTLGQDIRGLLARIIHQAR
jgi:hypothetical protein